MYTTHARGNLVHNLILFGRLLRALGLDINPGRMIDLVTALGYIEIQHKPDFYYSLRTLLVHRAEDLGLFDMAFELFWQAHDDEWKKINFQGPSWRKREPSVVFASFQVRKRANPPPPKDGQFKDRKEPHLEITRTYSPEEALRKMDFSELTEIELREIRQLIADINWQIGDRVTRRKRPGKGYEYDLRRTFRRNMRYGGEIMEWAMRDKKPQPRPLVVIADVSGSMERYTRLLLHFLYGLSEGLANRVEVFVFSTRLTRISHDLKHKNVDQAIRQVSRQVPDWSGGTRIGDAIKHFNFVWGRRVLGQSPVVLVISDGWDRGEVELLEREMDRLQRSCHRLIWLNPLLGSPDYQPLTRGIQAALPYIDDFLPVHNLESLEDLAMRLKNLNDSRPNRRQHPLNARPQ